MANLHQNGDSLKGVAITMDGKIALDIPVPGNLEAALGYEGNARYVGFWWVQEDSELAYCDGKTLVVGAVWTAWIAFTGHRVIAPQLARWELGSEEQQAKAVFLLDRVERRAYVMLRAYALHFLQTENESGPECSDARAVSRDELNSLYANSSSWLDAFDQPDEIAVNDTRSRLEREHARHDAMLAELDKAALCG